jgi:hypothetical protein
MAAICKLILTHKSRCTGGGRIAFGTICSCPTPQPLPSALGAG